MAYSVALLLMAIPVVLVQAQAPIYGQCGGIGWNGPTTCIAGSTCVISNDYYSQCIPSATTTTTPSLPGPSSTSTSPPPTSGISCTAPKTKFNYFGVNESGAEFAQTVWPGVLGKDYTWPSPSSIDFFVGKGFNTFRVPFLMERLSPPQNGLTGTFDSTYLDGLTTIVNYITSKGAYAAIDPHNYMRYNNAVISSTSDFETWWTNLATLFKSNQKVIFDIQNEPYGIAAATVLSLNQAAINGIRAAGATSQLILAEGTSWTGAWTWNTSGNTIFSGTKDPSNNFAIEMHQYLDSDGSGASPTCVSSTVGAERLSGATEWLKANNLKGFLGEIGGGSNSVCLSAVAGALCSMQQSGVWIGALWWAAGPWWGNYFQSIEPPSGSAVPSMLPLLQSFQ